MKYLYIFIIFWWLFNAVFCKKIIAAIFATFVIAANSLLLRACLLSPNELRNMTKWLKNY